MATAVTTKEPLPCPICGQPSHRTFTDVYDDRYGYPGRYTIRTCRSCRHRFVDATFTVEELSSQYTDFYPRAFRNLKDFRPHVELHGVGAWMSGAYSSAFRWVPAGVKILDVGCGFGETLAYHQARGSEAHGIDPDANLLRVAERYGLNARVGLFEPSAYEPEAFDYVTLDQVIEHVASPRDFLSGVGLVLRPRGFAILATPNAAGYGARLFRGRWINWHVPFHLQHFNRRSLRVLAERSGFAVVSMRTITNSNWLKYQWFHWSSRPPLGEASPFWAPERSARALPRGVYRVAALAERLRLFDLVSRTADALRLGDNIVAVLQKR